MPRFLPLAALAAVGLLACARPAPPAASSDTRQALSLPVPAQDAVRAEMNTMLSSLNQVLTALPLRDTAAIQRAAKASGLATAADPELEHLLPQQFLVWGTETHRGFDTLASRVASGAPPDSLLVQLGTITRGCVTCHATYRLAAR